MKSIQLIKPYLQRNLSHIIFGITALITLDIFLLIIPRIIKKVVDDLTGFQINFTGLLSYAGYIIVISLIIGALRYISRRSLFGTSRKIEEGLRNNLFEHIQTLSSSYFDQVKTGDLMAHATNDIQQIRMATGIGLIALTDAIFLGTAAIGFMAYINVKLTVLVLTPMPLIVLASRIFSRKMHRRYQQVQGAFSDLTEIVRERFAGIRTIKSFTREADEILNISDMSNEYINQNMRLVRVTGSFFPMMLLFSNLSLAIVLYVGGRQTILSVITPGDFVAFINYIALLTWPMMAMGWVTSLIQRGKASLDRIHTILLTTPEINEAVHAKPLLSTRGEIVFEKISFTYISRRENALTDISLKLKPGQILGIVGAQGSGKTTLLSLIPRLYDVSSGRVLLDGTDIRDFKIKDLRSQISYMPQEPILFAGTIRDNITFYSNGSDETDLIQSTHRAALYDTIQSFSHGFDTVVGEKGVILSGGQKQRIALARAIMNTASILILDDPISQVDKETGDTVIHSIRSLAESRTVMIVSHRLAALQFADNIIVLENGFITASGTHEELMERHPYYAKTFYMQEMEKEFNER